MAIDQLSCRFRGRSAGARVSIQNPFATQYFSLDGRAAARAVSFIKLPICKPIHNFARPHHDRLRTADKIRDTKPEPSVLRKNQRDSNMAEAKSNTLENPTDVVPRLSSGGSRRSSAFKYYIHDSVNSCRLQLLGELSETDLAELDGCWQTIKTTLSDRRLILDLRRLEGIDSASGDWLLGMASEGATYLPASYFSGVPEPNAPAGEKGKSNPFSRVLGILRSACAASVE
jgi:ABC-type transporter Mla MlaB component